MFSGIREDATVLIVMAPDLCWISPIIAHLIRFFSATKSEFGTCWDEKEEEEDDTFAIKIVKNVRIPETRRFLSPWLGSML